MKRFFTVIIVVSAINLLSAQIIDGQFITSADSNWYKVTIAVNMQSGNGSAGVVSLEFTYNSNDLFFPTDPIKNTDYILHGDYNIFSSQNITRPRSNAIRISLATDGLPPPVPLSTTPDSIITFIFLVNNFQGNSNLVWVTTEIAPAFLQPIYTIGNWPNKNEAPLPVELSTFAAQTSGESVQLLWQTKTEVNNYGFEIQRLQNKETTNLHNLKWEKIGFVKGNGNSNSPKEYSFVDKNPTGGTKFIYRLKQIDNDGTFAYSDEVEVELIPDKFELYQNYPNPFNPSTNIKFSLPAASLVRIDIYNIIGEHIRTLVNGEMEAGYHNVVFDASDLSSGTYIYRISTPNFTQTKKMLLLK